MRSMKMLSDWPSSSCLGLFMCFCSQPMIQPLLCASWPPPPVRGPAVGGGGAVGTCSLWSEARGRPVCRAPVTVQERVRVRQPVSRWSWAPLCLEVFLIQVPEKRGASTALCQLTFPFGLPRFKHMQIRVNAEAAAFFR